MSILKELASALGLRTQEPNSAVAEKCLAHPELLDEIVAGLADKNHRLAGDCAEVMTKVAEKQPKLVAPHVSVLLGLLVHKNGRVRWESAHALGLVAAHVPAAIEKAFERLVRIIHDDESVIVRDYVIDAIAGYGSTGTEAAGRTFPVLRDAADIFNGKHAARILNAMPKLVAVMPELNVDAREFAERFLEHPKAGVRKAAKILHKAVLGGKKTGASGH